jgi:hypothetical protein
MCSRVITQADGIQGPVASNFTNNITRSSQSVQGQLAPPSRLLLSMSSALFMLNARKNPLITEVSCFVQLLCSQLALCASRVEVYIIY